MNAIVQKFADPDQPTLFTATHQIIVLVWIDLFHYGIVGLDELSLEDSATGKKRLSTEPVKPLSKRHKSDSSVDSEMRDMSLSGGWTECGVDENVLDDTEDADRKIERKRNGFERG